MKKEELILNLGRFGYTLLQKETPLLKENEVLELLNELADSDDPRLVEGTVWVYGRRPRYTQAPLG